MKTKDTKKKDLVNCSYEVNIVKYKNAKGKGKEEVKVLEVCDL